MHIVYDHRIFSRLQQGGICRYVIELARALAAEPGVTLEIVAPLHLCRPLLSAPGLPVRGRYLPRIRRTTRLRLALNDWLGNRYYRRHRADIHHFTYYSARPVASQGAVSILTVHDMIHERFPEMLPAWEKRVIEEKKRAVARADHLICVSEQTRRDLVEILGVDPAKTTVIHHGCSFAPDTVCPDPPLVDRDYLLYVGLREGPKNFDALVRALAGSRLLGRELSLVCFGGGELSAAERGRIRAAGLDPDRIRQMNGDDRVLVNLYAHARALVYPSLYEGFGLPPLEAMACGCPVVCARAASLPEVAGEAVAWCDPEDTESIRRVIEEVAASEERRQQLIQAGRRQARRFSWSRCARETLEVYRRCRQR